MLLITGGFIAVAVLALVTAFLVARGGTKPAKLAQSAQIVQMKSESPTTPLNTPTPALEVGQQITEKRAAISPFQLQQLTARSQTEEQLEQLDFPEHPIPTYININRGATVSDFNTRSGASLSEQWTESSPYTERDITVLKRQLYELAGQLHLMQHKSRAIEQRVLEISRVLEHLDNENASKSAMSDSSSQISY